jgi:hypothetical protein
MPFKTNAKFYIDKVLNLMTLINDVDDWTNVAELKNKIQMSKCQIIKLKVDNNELIN